MIRKATITAIDVQQPGTANARFVINLHSDSGYEYFSTPFSSEQSVRINSQQIKAAFTDPELRAATNVFDYLLANRSKFVGRSVSFTVSPQIDRDTGQPKMNTRVTPNRPYTNVRLEPDSTDLTPEARAALLGGAGTVVPEGQPIPAAHADPANEADVPM